MRHAFLLFAFVPVLLYGQTSRPKGYLSPVDVQSLIVLIPPPPEENDVRDVVDQDVFLRTRGAKDTPRWAIARKDVDISVGGLMRAFSCTFGEATPKQQPHLAALLARVSSDSFALFDSLKIYYKKKRPFLIHDGPVCVDKKEIAKTYDYPSGHSTVGYTTGLILADLNVAKAPAILGPAQSKPDGCLARLCSRCCKASRNSELIWKLRAPNWRLDRRKPVRIRLPVRRTRRYWRRVRTKICLLRRRRNKELPRYPIHG
jgi:hypothetical protein